MWNWGKTWNQWGTILVKSSFEHDYYHRQKPAPIAPNFNSDCGQLQRRHTLSGWIFGTVFTDTAFNALRDLRDTFVVKSRNGGVSWLAVLRIFFLCFSCNGFSCNKKTFVFFSVLHRLKGKMLLSCEDRIIFYLLFNLRLKKNCDSSEWTNCCNQYSQLIIKVILMIFSSSTFFFPIYNLSLVGLIIVYTPSQCTT